MIRTLALTGVLSLALAWSAPTGAQNDSPFSYAEHTPSARLLAEASRSYEAGQFASALTKYEAAARWADKFAQFNIGVMHLKGQGTPFDPARALAWFQLAAERDYPMMVSMVDELDAMLDDATRRQAERIRVEELEPVYGDEVAIERTHRRMQRDRRQATGSRTGFAGFLKIVDRSGFTRDGTEFYAAEKWDFHHIVSVETQRMQALGDGRVELGELELGEDTPDPE